MYRERTEQGGGRREKQRKKDMHKQLTLVSLQIWHQCSSFPSHSASVVVGEGGEEGMGKDEEGGGRRREEGWRRGEGRMERWYK